MFHNIVCELKHCIYNSDYRCKKLKVHIDADGNCIDYELEVKE